MSALTAAEVVADGIKRTGRRQLKLLILGWVVVLLSYTLVGLATTETIPPGLGAYGGSLAAFGLAAHVVSRRFAPGADPFLLPVAFTLNGLGLVMIRRIDYRFDWSNAQPQTMWTLFAIIGFCAVLLVLRDYRTLDNYRYLIGIGAIIFLMLPLAPGIGHEVNGAQIWLRIGGFQIQPGEVAKIMLAVFFASYLADKRQLLSVASTRFGPLSLPPARAFGPILVMWAASLLVLVRQNDLGLSLLLFGMFVLLMYVATGQLIYVLGGGALFGAGALAAIQMFGHVRQRLAIWIDPFDDWQGQGFQLVQSLFALGNGGVIGQGLGQGLQVSIPFVHTDFIFTAFSEELGLVGAVALLLLFFILVGRGFHVALTSPDDFGRLLAACLTIVFALQVFVIIGGVTRLIPLSGLTLPFVSYGGSSLVANYVLIALLMRISSTTNTRGLQPA